jgi:hypothetical protein
VERVNGMIVDLQVIAKDWQWLMELDRFKLLAISPFGDLLLQDETGKISLLDINAGELEETVGEEADPAQLFPIAFDDHIAKSYREAGLVLSPGKCYGYKRPGVAGGSIEPANVYVATLPEYVSFMGDFHHQIKDIPDGTNVTLKVINWPPKP